MLRLDEHVIALVNMLLDEDDRLLVPDGRIEELHLAATLAGPFVFAGFVGGDMRVADPPVLKAADRRVRGKCCRAARRLRCRTCGKLPRNIFVDRMEGLR